MKRLYHLLTLLACGLSSQPILAAASNPISASPRSLNWNAITMFLAFVLLHWPLPGGQPNAPDPLPTFTAGGGLSPLQTDWQLPVTWYRLLHFWAFQP
jgi:hypothetical protein